MRCSGPRQNDNCTAHKRLADLHRAGGLATLAASLAHPREYCYELSSNREPKHIPVPVRVFSLKVEKTTLANAATAPMSGVAAPHSNKRLIRLTLAEGIVAPIVTIAAGAGYFLMRPGPSPTANAPAHLSVVALPFAKVAQQRGFCIHQRRCGT